MKTKLSTLQTKADSLASKYIRQKYARHDGTVACVSCETVLPWKEAHCAHYIGRRHISTRYIEDNLHPACPRCNVFNVEYHMRQYTLYMIDFYGRDKVDDLNRESRRTLSASEKRAIIEGAIEYYGNALKGLER